MEDFITRVDVKGREGASLFRAAGDTVMGVWDVY